MEDQVLNGAFFPGNVSKITETAQCGSNLAPLEVIMAAIGLHRGSYQARIRRTGYPAITKTFVRKKDAVAWAVLTERKIEQDEYVADGLLKFVTLADSLDRYQDEITPTKRSA